MEWSINKWNTLNCFNFSLGFADTCSPMPKCTEDVGDDDVFMVSRQ